MMKINDRLDFIDQCVAGERTRFEQLLSINIFNSFDRSYEAYRDYIRQKSKIKDISCDVTDETLVLHIVSSVPMEELLSENFPKKGVLPVATERGVDLNIKLMDNIF